MVRDKVLEFVKEGTEQIEMTNPQVHEGIDLDATLVTPIIVIPENIRNDDKDKEAIVFNIGKFVASGKLIDYDKHIDYKEETREDKMYDQYKLEFKGLRLSMVKDLDRYEDWEESHNKMDIIKQIKISLFAQR